MTYRTEFPDYPPAAMPAIPAGWIDTSWHNDACPSFQSRDGGPQVFIDYADAARREIQGWPRFNVIDDEGHTLLASDDWAAVLEVMADADA